MLLGFIQPPEVLQYRPEAVHQRRSRPTRLTVPDRTENTVCFGKLTRVPQLFRLLDC